MPKINELPLNKLLATDALTCTAMGAALLVASAPISAITQIPQALLFWAGFSLLPIAAFMAVTATFAPASRWMVSLIILGNALWVALSLLLPVGGFVSPNTLGWVFLLGQAAIVAIITKLEFDASKSPRLPLRV
ncbi:hypothetical protein P6U16_15885 [Rhizobium sp. 32-5/1]|uniref:hypothetical protein n=1 Tax=Rhizobium sp. 32-5/1 TaxID=3019602 RepID=UPI00240D947B|nr:hypothetical protein [Rhizobium sp. 32-5/1]WEZ82551.1 hypothetical protein P6U16_15885 [Rhizobium sp. 32-5/1]